MKYTNLKHLTISFALAITGLFIITGQAIAQQTTEEVLVLTAIDKSEARVPIGSSVETQTVNINRHVSFADLDLTSQSDVSELDTRIGEVAKESCEELSDLFPLDRSDMTEMNICMKRAIASVSEQKEMAIATANES